jgi:hypothetical protein
LAIAGVTTLPLLELEPELALLLPLFELPLLPQPAAMAAAHARITPVLTSFVFTFLLLLISPSRTRPLLPEMRHEHSSSIKRLTSPS